MRNRVTRAGLALAVVCVAGAVVFFVGSGKVAWVGGLVALLAAAFAVADQLPVGVGGGWMVGKGQRWKTERAAPEPEYIAAADEPSDEEWRREQQRYEEKNDGSR